MIELYCSRHHRPRAGLCPECQKLLEYSDARLDRCPFGDEKPTCAKCRVHCYAPQMRETIRQVMRFSGPRMLARHPVMAIRHSIDGRRKAGKGGRKAEDGSEREGGA